MDTRWKRFRYGTEDRNPSWSFFGAVLCPGFAAIMLALSRGGWFWTIPAFCFLVISVISWIHLGQSMKNQKKNLVSVRFLDGTFPDLILVLLLGILACNLDVGWQDYSHTVKLMFQFLWQPLIFLWYFVCLMFLSGSPCLFMVILYMSVMRHRCSEKLRRKLFFSRLKKFGKEKARTLQNRWGMRQLARVEKGEAAKLFRRRQIWLLCGQNAVFLMAILWIWVDSGWWDVEYVLAVLTAMETVCFLVNLLFLLKTSEEVGVLLDQIGQIAEDRPVSEQPVLKPYSLFRKAEESLVSIRKTKRESMEKQLQSERMKVELITNVSHDLKTPLTSMIGCIDLLKQVEELPQEARDYVTLLSAKAERLRGMIQDVFDMAKAASGQEVQLERLDMARLIRQTAADMQDRMERSGLQYRMKIEDRELPFLGDSRKMYRVYQNLIENTLKYSMAGSRVYVEVSERDGKIRTSVKNISGCEMDFSAEEVMERFVRGDKSRTTEGNGLGLAIARSFTEACGGSFQVTLDGDLFRVDTVFPMADKT